MKKKILLIDINYKSSLPDHLIYTAIQIEGRLPDYVPIVLKAGNADKDNVIFREITPEVIAVLLWHQNWLNGLDGLKMLSIAKRIKQISGKIKVIAGGYLATLAPEIYESQDCFDCVLVGYPWNEEIIDALFLNTKENILTPKHSAEFPQNLDLSKGEKYFNPSSFFINESSNRMSTYSFSYNCNNGCSFCYNYSFLKSGGGIVKDFKTIENEINFLSSKYGVNIIESKDPNIFVDKNCGLKVLELFAKSQKVKLSGNIDIMVKDMSEEIFDLLVSAGVSYIFFGLESLDKNVQSDINKPLSMEKLDKLLSYGEAKKLFFMANLMIGIGKDKTNPLTKSDIKQEKSAISYLLKKYLNLEIQMRLFMPLLGTPLGDKIWSETKNSKDIDLKSYLNLIDMLVKNKKFDSKNILPSCYGSVEVVNYAVGISNALLMLNSARIMVNNFRNKNPFIKIILNLRQKALQYAFDKYFYNFIKFESSGFNLIKTAYKNLRKL